MWDGVTQNIRAAARGIRKTPGVSAAIVITLALGIGANAMMFGVIDRLLLSPPQHIADADRVRHVYVERTASNGVRQPGRLLTYPDFEDLGAAARACRRRGLQLGRARMDDGRGRGCAARARAAGDGVAVSDAGRASGAWAFLQRSRRRARRGADRCPRGGILDARTGARRERHRPRDSAQSRPLRGDRHRARGVHRRRTEPGRRVAAAARLGIRGVRQRRGLRRSRHVLASGRREAEARHHRCRRGGAVDDRARGGAACL